MSSELLDNSVEYDEDIFEYLKVKDEKEEAPPELVESDQDEKLFTFINQLNESYILEKLKKDGMFIRYVNNPTEKMKTVAIKNNINSIYYIDDISDELVMDLIKKNGCVISFIKKEKQTEEMKLEAVKQNPNAIIHIHNPTEEMKMIAVKKNGNLIRRFRDDASEELKLVAFKQNKKLKKLFIQNVIPKNLN